MEKESKTGKSRKKESLFLKSIQYPFPQTVLHFLCSCRRLTNFIYEYLIVNQIIRFHRRSIGKRRNKITIYIQQVLFALASICYRIAADAYDEHAIHFSDGNVRFVTPFFHSVIRFVSSSFVCCCYIQ